jgi:hypothetical protein
MADHRGSPGAAMKYTKEEIELAARIFAKRMAGATPLKSTIETSAEGCLHAAQVFYAEAKK